MARRFFVGVVLVLAVGFMSVPTVGVLGTLQSAWAEENAHAEQTVLININTAQPDELATLTGVGEMTAQAIVAYREANGPFAAPEDIMNVKGVGEKKYEAIKDQITVGKAK